MEQKAGKVRKGISGSTLKLIAIITMLGDHIGAAILERIMIAKGFAGSTSVEEMRVFIENNSTLYYMDMGLRLIGRISFPIFCFLLIEGFCHTHDVKKYLMRLFGFALLSEVPFDLAFSGKIFALHYQNVFFTLFIGILVLTAFEWVHKKEMNQILQILCQLAAVAVGITLTYLLRVDYAIYGVLIIVLMYLLRKNKIMEMLAGCIGLNAMSLSEITAFFALIPISLYNGKRGWNLKYILYLFYPVHLIILYLIAYALGISYIQVV